MSGVGVTHSESQKARARRIRERFVASGTNISEWARERGFSVSLVQSVLQGDRPCRRGESHRIAVALGLKDEVPAPGTDVPVRSTAPDRLEGVRP
ncbi:DNA-binding protein [Sphingobium wenxiniae]|uniref:DNA-binding protein n=1 Tax=Sphingobium wenxiniae (strain DSM 21828 / CGMCC 1.7748 / JZ-1) TaxID=595605 RepID=UPI00119E3B30